MSVTDDNKIITIISTAAISFKSYTKMQHLSWHDCDWLEQIITLMSTAAFSFKSSTRMQHLPRHECDRLERDYHNYIHCSNLVQVLHKNAALGVTRWWQTRTKLSQLSPLQQFRWSRTQKWSTCGDTIVTDSNEIITIISTAAISFKSYTKIDRKSVV